jgi:hypothetical protein
MIWADEICTVIINEYKIHASAELARNNWLFKHLLSFSFRSPFPWEYFSTVRDGK